MSKREEAYKLFSDGYLPDSDEVKALGLAEKTGRYYYNGWLKNLTAAPSGPQVILTGAAAMQARAEERLECPYDGAALELCGEYMNLPYYKCPECGWGTVRHK